MKNTKLKKRQAGALDRALERMKKLQAERAVIEYAGPLPSHITKAIRVCQCEIDSLEKSLGIGNTVSIPLNNSFKRIDRIQQTIDLNSWCPDGA